MTKLAQRDEARRQQRDVQRKLRQQQEFSTMNLEELVQNARFTILLGKNGSGKSTLLRALDSGQTFNTNYLTPERGGTLKYDPNIDVNLANNERWITNDRRKNRTEHFRQQSATQFRNLEMLVLREIERDKDKREDPSYTFDKTLQKINDLLPAIELRRSDRGFKIFSKQGEEIGEDAISSGESELIALSIEVLVYAREASSNKVLLMDEPDVHLHPDLQQRFIAFVEQTAREFDFRVVLATHSTAIIGAFSKGDDVQIAPITRRDQTEFPSFLYSPVCHSILPVFGAHPLSAQFNKSPPLLVEGEDDKRVMDQIVRSAGGRVCFTPCVVGTVSEMLAWETWLNNYLPSIYDDPKGFSLRDLDDAGQSNIDDVGCVARARLNCYEIENLLLTEECLAEFGHSADSFVVACREWVSQRPEHAASSALNALADKFDDRRTMKIKDVRNVLVALLGAQKPWEVVVAQLVVKHLDSGNDGSHSIKQYLGSSVLHKLFGKADTIS
jgi:predicted ATPase